MSIKKERILLNCNHLKITLYKAGKGEPFHWKPKPCAHLDSFCKYNYASNERYEMHLTPPEGGEPKPVMGDVYHMTSYFVPTRTQIFWLGYVIDIELKPEAISRRKFTPIDYGKTAIVHP